ncbi:MAG: zinc ribbon domain-containing protein [Chloroflexota bacterium]|nr:zinc ribbon domain-containing protein [Chloroflexota bacterium]
MKIILSIGSILLLVTVWLGREAAESTYAQESPRLASLEIDIWPEFDRPAALVILRAEIAGDVTLPATVSLRIPTSSGGPAALASAASADSQLFDLPYQRTDAQVDFITLTFSTPDRFFQLEFYDPLRIDTADRNYTYVWPGDLPVDQLSVELQQPAGAADLSVQPELGAGVVNPDGLVYRQADLGAFDMGNGLTIDIRYRKTDPRTSAEILGLETRAPPSAAEGTGSEVPRWLLVLPVLAALVIGASGVILWRRRGWLPSTSARRMTRAGRRREQAAGQPENVPHFCPRCGNRLRSRDRFCPECGTAVRTS